MEVRTRWDLVLVLPVKAPIDLVPNDPNDFPILRRIQDADRALQRFAVVVSGQGAPGPVARIGTRDACFRFLTIK